MKSDDKMAALLSQDFKSYMEFLENENNSLEHANSYLKTTLEDQIKIMNEIHSSLGWRAITKLRNSKSLYSVSYPLRRLLKRSAIKLINEKVAKQEENIALFEQQISKIYEAPFVAIHHPEWIGVSNSTKDLFGTTASLQMIVGEKEAEKVADVIINAKIPKIIFSGFASGYDLVVKMLKKKDPTIWVSIFWHGNTTHMYEEYSWLRHEEIIELYQGGYLDFLGFAKKSMAELYATQGFKTAFVMNHIDVQKEKWVNNNSNLRIGLYSSGNYWNKNAFAQIAAVSTIKDATIYATPNNHRLKEFAKLMNTRLTGPEFTISRELLYEDMTKNILNLYVTFTECSPMIPLESLSLGVPCLTGPNHHYFKNTLLEDYLVVHSPDDPMEIAAKALRAIKEKDNILALYLDWVTQYNEKAKKSVIDFIGCEIA